MINLIEIDNFNKKFNLSNGQELFLFIEKLRFSNINNSLLFNKLNFFFRSLISIKLFIF